MVCDERQRWQHNFYFPKTLRVGESFECAQIHVLIRKLSSSKKESEHQCLVLTAPFGAGKMQLQWRGCEKAVKVPHPTCLVQGHTPVWCHHRQAGTALFPGAAVLLSGHFAVNTKHCFRKKDMKLMGELAPCLLPVPSGRAPLFLDLYLFCLGRNSSFLPFLL